MSAAAINEKLSSAECEQIAERFVRAMADQASGRAGGTVTAATLTELWQDVLEWTGIEIEQLPGAMRAPEAQNFDPHPRRHFEWKGKPTTIKALAAIAGCSFETMRGRLHRMTPEAAVAMGRAGPAPRPFQPRGIRQ